MQPTRSPSASLFRRVFDPLRPRCLGSIRVDQFRGRYDDECGDPRISSAPARSAPTSRPWTADATTRRHWGRCCRRWTTSRRGLSRLRNILRRSEPPGTQLKQAARLEIADRALRQALCVSTPTANPLEPTPGPANLRAATTEMPEWLLHDLDRLSRLQYSFFTRFSEIALGAAVLFTMHLPLRRQFDLCSSDERFLPLDEGPSPRLSVSVGLSRKQVLGQLLRGNLCFPTFLLHGDAVRIARACSNSIRPTPAESARQDSARREESLVEAISRSWGFRLTLWFLLRHRARRFVLTSPLLLQLRLIAAIAKSTESEVVLAPHGLTGGLLLAPTSCGLFDAYWVCSQTEKDMLLASGVPRNRISVRKWAPRDTAESRRVESSEPRDSVLIVGSFHFTQSEDSSTWICNLVNSLRSVGVDSFYRPHPKELDTQSTWYARLPFPASVRNPRPTLWQELRESPVVVGTYSTALLEAVDAGCVVIQVANLPDCVEEYPRLSLADVTFVAEPDEVFKTITSVLRAHRRDW